MVTGSVVPWGERYELKRQAERRAANKSAPLTKLYSATPGRTQGKGISTHDNDRLNVLGKKILCVLIW